MGIKCPVSKKWWNNDMEYNDIKYDMGYYGLMMGMIWEGYGNDMEWKWYGNDMGMIWEWYGSDMGMIWDCIIAARNRDTIGDNERFFYSNM